MTSRQAVVSLAVLAVAALALPRHVIAQADPKLPVILAVGESTTAGYGVPRELSYPSQLQQELDKRGYRYRVVNHGVSGSTTRDALTRLDRGVALLPKIVIIALGGNDGGSRMPIETTRANLGKMISLFKRVGAEVFVMDWNLPADRRDDAGSIFADLAKEHHAVLMPPLLTGVAGDPDLFIGDRSHPNGEGYKIVVGNVLKVIEPYLKKPDAVSFE